MDYITTPHQAELNAAEVMKSWGYTDSVATTGGADGGIDVTSRDALAQVKWRGGAAGRPDLQRLYGARGSGTQQLIFFAASDYTAQAIEYAGQVDVALYIYDPVGSVEPVNETARRIMVGGGVTNDWQIDSTLIRVGTVVALTLMLIVVALVAILFIKNQLGI
ncbi:restriction endonuclease [Rhodococcus qingshengii]|uniref:restriction endonuclease n=1 Tax=Rhodococcus qingshengii TaxID=334542 RepID=UPI0029427468|nr:restriction endonuclease [Rhodococcus qingshengii]WOI85987.1 restriction endonuclease [Rhodococcus qingshengii]